MNIRNFKYYWRYNDENYAVFSDVELSEISVIPKDKAKREWLRICGGEIFQKSLYIKDIIDHNAPVLIKDCHWGDDETYAKNKFLSFFNEFGADKVSIYYDDETALQLSSSLFCARWSDFCYPSDLNLIIFPSVMIVYYEDIVYGPYKI